MKPITAAAVFTLIAVPVLATPRKVDIQVDSLELKNGRTFPAATIKTYDYDTGNVVIMTGRSLSSVQLELLPDEWATRVLGVVPPESKAVARDERLAKEADKRLAQARAEAAEKKREFQQKQRTGAAQIDREAQHRLQMLARVKATARTRADQYFRYDFIHGSSTYVFATDIELDEPEAVSGWPDRYRVCGRAGVRYYVSQGSSLNTTSREFEVTLQADGKGNLKTVDFTCH